MKRFSPRALAEAMTRRGQPTSERQAWSILQGLEHRGVVEVAGAGFWMLTRHGLELARDLAYAFDEPVAASPGVALEDRRAVSSGAGAAMRAMASHPAATTEGDDAAAGGLSRVAVLAGPGSGL